VQGTDPRGDLTINLHVTAAIRLRAISNGSEVIELRYNPYMYSKDGKCSAVEL
jgi:hypothetical protein